MKRQDVYALFPLDEINTNHRGLVGKLDCVRIVRAIANPRRALTSSVCPDPNKGGHPDIQEQPALVQEWTPECAVTRFVAHQEPRSVSRKRSRCMSFGRRPPRGKEASRLSLLAYHRKKRANAAGG